MSQHVRGNIVDDIDPVDVRTGTILPAGTDIQVSIYTHLTKYKEEQAIQVLDKHLNERNNEPQKPLLRVLWDGNFDSV